MRKLIENRRCVACLGHNYIYLCSVSGGYTRYHVHSLLLCSPTACVTPFRGIGGWAEARCRTGENLTPRKMPENAAHTHLSTARCVGRFLPFAIYSQTDSPQECQSNEKYHETKLFSCQRDHHEYPHPPSARLALNRSGKDDFKFSLAANSAI